MEKRYFGRDNPGDGVLALVLGGVFIGASLLSAATEGTWWALLIGFPLGIALLYVAARYFRNR